VLVLRYWSGLSEAEIAKILGISRGGVSSQASRAIVKLEAILEASR
jgi:RNA polymerase sigma factor (sigma-70 family)